MMPHWFTVFILMALLATLVPATHAQEDDAAVRFVSDIIYVPVRSGPGIQYRIIYSRLRSGMEVSWLGDSEDGDWSQIRTRGGTEGWVEKQYLINQPTARLQLDEVRGNAQQATEQLTAVTAELREQRARAETLQAELDSVTGESAALATELANLKTLSADAVNLNERYRELLAKHNLLQTDYDVVRAENDRLLADRKIRQWLVGAGLVLGGMLLMLVLPSLIPNKRNSDWIN